MNGERIVVFLSDVGITNWSDNCIAQSLRPDENHTTASNVTYWGESVLIPFAEGALATAEVYMRPPTPGTRPELFRPRDGLVHDPSLPTEVYHTGTDHGFWITYRIPYRRPELVGSPVVTEMLHFDVMLHRLLGRRQCD